MLYTSNVWQRAMDAKYVEAMKLFIDEWMANYAKENGRGEYIRNSVKRRNGITARMLLRRIKRATKPRKDKSDE